MPQPQILQHALQKLDSSICEIHKISKTDLCTIHIRTRDESLFATYRLLDDGKATRIADSDDSRVFAVASLFKPFIAVGVARMIEDLSVSRIEGHQRYHKLQGAWNKTFTEVFNDSSDVKIKPLKGDPTVMELMVHLKGAYNMNHLLLAPDGSPLLSDDDFRDIISQFTIDARKQHSRKERWAIYSNGNYILLALLIQVVSGMSLRDFLKQYVFEPLGMGDIYMTADKLDALGDKLLAKGNTVSGTGVRHPVAFDHIPYLADTVEFAVAGGHISAAGFGMFFQVILRALFDTPQPSWFNERFARILLTSKSNMDGYGNGYTPCGIFTKLHECWPGSHSLNQTIFPKSQYKDYVLGTSSDGKEIEAQYLAGSATGWASTAYLLPKQEISIIVLSNTSGPLDVTDLISKLCLSEILDLNPAKYTSSGKLEPTFLGPATTPHDKRSQVHYVELARRIYTENLAACRELEAEDSLPDTRVVDCPNICGTFVNAEMHQSLRVFDAGGMLRVKLIGSKESGTMRFVRCGKGFRICSFPINNSSSLAIDCFGAWRTRDFQFEETGQSSACLVRKGLGYDDRFVRELTN
ncbi:beta-lactamase/transpeptidase-like protein [Bisporella sp. PMI_857]|nr:beta-lactamase/transpeptidase-like protein [Bisporella sp. PMI_857]